MGPPYTLGEWIAEEGREQDFIDAWQDLARWTERNVEGASWAKLLRDRAEPGRFISFSPWRDDGAIAAWRERPGFQARVARIRELVTSFAPHTLDVAGEVGPATPDP